MSDDLRCNVCAHLADQHRYADPIKCQRCPDGICQPGKEARSGAPAELARTLYERMVTALRSTPVWVMDLGWYKRIRRDLIDNTPDDDDKDRWVPSAADRLLGQRIIVRDGGGEPHIEWLTPEQIEAA